MMTFGRAPFGAKSGSSRPDTRDASVIRRSVVAAATALSLFVISGVSYADDPSDDATTPAATSQPATEGTAEPTADPAEAPVLLWEARDGDDNLLEGLTFQVQGPRDDSAPDDGEWKKASASTVEDNTGQADYDGLDDDPAPGAFRVAYLDDQIGVLGGCPYGSCQAAAAGFAW
jgi:hypothetical protein